MASRLLPPLICLLAAAAGLAYIELQPGAATSAQASGAGGPAHDSYSPEAFRRDFPAELKLARNSAGQSELSNDATLDKWLTEHGHQLSATTLEKYASVEMSGFKSTRLSAADGADLRGLMRSLCDLLSADEEAPDNRMAFLMRKAPDGRHEVFVLTGEALPELTLSGLNNSAADTFVSQCPHCRKQVALSYTKSSCGFAVDCPTCRRRCRVIAQDTNGKYHDVTTFLLPSVCPEVSAGTSPLDTMLYLWRVTVSRCRYVEDSGRSALADFWQTPPQTLRRGAGDCEDSSLLLTDWLLTRGISARMAMGAMEGGGHAWCIARVDGTDYLLESTDRHPDMNLLPVINPDNGYEPTSLIDRDALYVRAQPNEPFDGDYWSAEKWIRLPRPKPAAAKTAANSPAATAGAKQNSALAREPPKARPEKSRIK